MRDDHGRSPLDRVFEDVYGKDDLDLGLYLIKHGCDDEGKVKLMREACFWGNLDVVEELVKLHKVDPKGDRIYCSTQCITLSYTHLCCADVRDNTDSVHRIV